MNRDRNCDFASFYLTEIIFHSFLDKNVNTRYEEGEEKNLAMSHEILTKYERKNAGSCKNM